MSLRFARPARMIALLGAALASWPLVASEDRAGADIVRDTHGVPHVFSADLLSATFGLGFAQAQDRLWQMEIARRRGDGRLAEIIGPEAIDSDRLARTLGLRQAAVDALAHLDAATVAWLRAYADGVNAFLRGQPDLPPQFTRLAVKPAPWTAADSVLVMKLIALELGGNWQDEAARADLMTRLSRAQVDDFLINEFPGPHRLPDLRSLYGTDMSRIAALKARKPDGIGSNNWVVSGERSDTGKPLLANDPHLALTAPAFFHLAHLAFNGGDIVGAFVPGIPGAIVGHNGRVAWGVTDTAPDVQDLFVEEVDGSRPSRYRTPTGWATFATRTESIRVRNSDPVTLRIRTSRHGPVLSDLTSFAPVGPRNRAVALAWTALLKDDTTLQGLRKILTSRNGAEFKSALRDWHTPQLSFLYADTDADIGLIAPGRIPIRHRDNLVEGQLPVPGWMAIYDWQGFIPFESLPQRANPAAGALWTANTRIVADDYPYLIAREWPLSHRARRIAQLIDTQPRHSMQSFRTMQADVVSLRTQELLAPMLAALPAPEGELQPIVAALRQWRGDHPIDRPEPAIFATWYTHFIDLLYADEFGAAFKDHRSQNPLFVLRVLTDAATGNRWCDDVRTAKTEDCGTLLKRALLAGLAELRETRGLDWRTWRWGDLHQARSRGAPYPGGDDAFDIVIAAPGGEGTVNVGGYNINAARPYEMKQGAVLRAIFDLADLDRSEFILQTGVSEDPRSAHYRDMNVPWRDGRYITILTVRDGLKKQSGRAIRVQR